MIRDTAQRRAIRRAFEAADRPLSPQEILRDAKEEVPGLGLATVYRTVKGLQEDGAIVAVEIPGEAPRYELSGKVHHHHFCCRDCGRVFELDGCPGNFEQLVPRGFEMEGHELVLYGRCDACAGNSDRS